ncbi:P-loop ATPase, Sll1717 family [Aureivirga sp. CE67]|uniref:P-loop ATPase, Sll1717 family n=1 Tax=Aureivirga sp. CE67 TaxID=1788983 RepID=UPI0018CA5AA9|nr:hypothetical protein [Aureivirga sp. CE67]
MSIFDNISLNSKVKDKLTTKDFYFGATEAEAENVTDANLLKYFDDYLLILNKLQIGKFIFTGRKGVGKSAIAKFIKDSSEKSNNSFAKILKIGDFELEKYIQEVDTECTKERLVFEWLILINLVKLIVKNECGIYTNEFNKLQRFLKVNSGIIDIDEFQFINGEKNIGGEVNISPLKHVFNGVVKNYFKSNVNKAPFYKVIPALRDIIKIILDYPINKEKEFWLLFDDLDINFKSNDEKSNNKLMDLIRISKEYNNSVLKNNSAKILIFIREDIRNSLLSNYADSAKIFNSYEIIINWYVHNYDENELPLKKMINKRIKINFERNNIVIKNEEDPWNDLFFPAIYNNKTSFKYVLDFTFYRPRDIITFLNIVAEENYEVPIQPIYLKKILKKYIKKNILEIKSELSLFFNFEQREVIFKELFQFMLNKSDGLSKNDILEKIENLKVFDSPSLVLDILIQYSLIVIIDDQNNLYFHYREDTDIHTLNSSEYRYTLPKFIYYFYKRIN